MKSVTTADFRKGFRALPADVRQQAKSAYRLWAADPKHPSLHFRRVHAVESVFSVRIGIHYRAVALVEGGVANWFWIGTHSDYDKLIRSL
ncbi:MAG: hypothetical protein AMXMBFR19_19850 [Chthonomonadaceae bacterium]|uniref:ParE-like toxin domain-containing protein n=1 Tax=Candidatus Nitrosymbiomonas proteolyticus TaxID=2608984 RepID=A0A809R8H5_9BACT|nr:conserved hypothetical protein [Candidatus Nitrosymbiomonas proteolyticus]